MKQVIKTGKGLLYKIEHPVESSKLWEINIL